MDLRAALQHPEFSGLTDQQAKTLGDQPSAPLLITTLQSVAAFADVFPVEDSRLVVGTIKQAAAMDPLVDAFYLKLCSKGVDFSNAKIQSQLDQLGELGHWSSDLTAKMKGFGVVAQTVWQSFGLDAEPTLEAIATARQQIAVAQWWAHVANEIVGPMLSTSTSEQIKSAIANYSWKGPYESGSFPFANGQV